MYAIRSYYVSIEKAVPVVFIRMRSELPSGPFPKFRILNEIGISRSIIETSVVDSRPESNRMAGETLFTVAFAEVDNTYKNFRMPRVIPGIEDGTQPVAEVADAADLPLLLAHWNAYGFSKPSRSPGHLVITSYSIHYTKLYE